MYWKLYIFLFHIVMYVSLLLKYCRWREMGIKLLNSGLCGICGTSVGSNSNHYFKGSLAISYVTMCSIPSLSPSITPLVRAVLKTSSGVRRVGLSAEPTGRRWDLSYCWWRASERASGAHCQPRFPLPTTGFFCGKSRPERVSQDPPPLPPYRRQGYIHPPFILIQRRFLFFFASVTHRDPARFPVTATATNITVAGRGLCDELGYVQIRQLLLPGRTLWIDLSPFKAFQPPRVWEERPTRGTQLLAGQRGPLVSGRSCLTPSR